MNLTTIHELLDRVESNGAKIDCETSEAMERYILKLITTSEGKRKHQARKTQLRLLELTE